MSTCEPLVKNIMHYIMYLVAIDTMGAHIDMDNTYRIDGLNVHTI
jgi:hypothetical protein